MLNFALSTSINEMLAMINTQQLLILLPLMTVLLPNNASAFFKRIFTIAAFDLYDMNEFYQDLLGVPDSGPYNEKMEDFGFESCYILSNMGTMILFYITYSLLMLVQYCLRRCRNVCSCASINSRKLRNHLYFSLLLTTVFESYSLVILTCLIAIPSISFESWGLFVQSAVCIAFTSSFLTAPFFLIQKLVRNMELLGKKVT